MRKPAQQECGPSAMHGYTNAGARAHTHRYECCPCLGSGARRIGYDQVPSMCARSVFVLVASERARARACVHPRLLPSSSSLHPSFHPWLHRLSPHTCNPSPSRWSDRILTRILADAVRLGRLLQSLHHGPLQVRATY